jgi:outer membrane protein assembly complex protein YaeT
MKNASLRYLLMSLAALGALFWAAPSGRAQPSDKSQQIANVYIVGTRTISTDKVMQYIHSKPGQFYDYKTVQDDVSRLAAARLFKSILRVKTDPTPDGRLNLYFEVLEHANVVREVIYKHAKHTDLKELEDLTRVHPGMPLDVYANRNACFELQDHLKKQGYFFANVRLEEGNDEHDDRVIFNITEGPVLRVSKVSFVGNHEFVSAARLNTQVETSKAFAMSFGGKFNDAMVAEDIIKLETYYKNNGYRNVHVSRELKFSDDFHWVEVIFHVQEGIRFRVQDWKLEGTFQNLPREQLESIVMIKKDDWYNQLTVSKDVANLTNYVGWRGYKTDVKEHVEAVDDNPGVVRVHYEVDDHPMAYVGEVIIVGNNITQDKVIRRQLQNVPPGQVLRYPELKIAEAQLARLNIFEMNPELGVRPTVTVLENDNSVFKDILVKVQETRTGSLMLGAGINSDNGFVGSIVLNERNFDIFRFPTSFADFFDGKAFRGAGQELRIEAVPGTEIQRYTITVREPYLLDLPYSLTESVYYRERLFNEYTEARVGDRITLGHQFTKEWSASVGLRIEEINVFNVGAGAPPDYTTEIGEHFLVAPGITVAYDTRDSFMKPTEGGKIEFQYEQVFGANTFPIFNLEGTRYFTTWQRPDGSGKHVLMFRSQISWEGDQAPVYERFFGGGYMSIRGFAFRGVGPETNGFFTGGQFQWLNSAEYQIPIRANDQLYMVAFVDSGTVESKIGIQDYRVSAGFGLRITVPMMGPVPIALDFGFPIVKAPGDQTQIFSFWVGLYR